MAEVSNITVIGEITCRMTGWDDPTVEDTQLHKLNRYDKALGSAGHGQLHLRPASFFVWSLYLFTQPNNDTKESMLVAAPFPLTIWAADVGCESAAGTAATLDIEVDGVSILDAPEDIKTGAGTGQRVAPEDGDEDVDYDSTINLSVVGTGAGAVVGAQAHLYAQRL